MDVLVTGAHGRVGSALVDHQSGQFDYALFDRRDHPRLETIVGDIATYNNVSAAVEGRDAVVHLAADPNVDAEWDSLLENNLIGVYNCLEACRRREVDSLVLASSNHVVGMYERDHAPDIYESDYDLCLDHRAPVRPDSAYGATKAFLEAFGRYYAEAHDHPRQVYALRFGSLRYPQYDHPYGDAEAGVDEGKWERNDEAYRRAVRRMKATWQSRRDAAALVESCLADEAATFEMFYGVSDNSRRWFDINRARDLVGYDPQDSGDDWDQPPADPWDPDSVAVEPESS